MTDVRAARSRATIQDVADEAGLSRGTVSRVLNDEPYVSAEAREAVQAAVRRVGYVRSAAARSLVTRRSGAVALIVHEPSVQVLDDPNIGNILIGTNAVLSEADQQLVTIMVDSARDNERVVEYLRGGFVDGAIVLSARDGDPVTRAIEEIGLPACFVGHPSDAANTSYIAIDNRAAAEAITRRLVDTGRRRIGMLASGLDRDSGQDRLEGFTAALGDRFDPDLVARNPLFSYTAGVEGMRELLDRAPDVDGVFAASDAVAAGAMDVLQRAGRSVPGDVGVVGFDDSAWALRCDPPLSTVRQPARTLGEHAARQVLEQIAGTDDGPRGLILPTEVVWRASA
ncbi:MULTISPECIES: LacI family DNA-binding transcriptional regulator [unclassified Curtobacterium]|uniref:LacI family DNA-binding transcriptional regulator n=1 Tax=unclassified Curtobacterium TaxID=257496 RepID=UPI0008243935|nr:MULTISPECIES: LacI family DNA-binding transcriptional regulator [unclassified Curtobacterium]WIA97120.1 LacI family DNA-binding transcriptional regulator [Curtobacterium sp. MCBA15_004]WIB00448.1 LacI family DNA-binding transcriptional regulator [Curtobacterium sp. MCBA15_012]